MFEEIGNDYYYTCGAHEQVIIPNPKDDPIDTAAHMIFINKTWQWTLEN